MTREEACLLKEKFYAATATPHEERQLAAWLRSDDCPKEWSDERRALLALLPDEEATLPEGFGLRMAQRLEQERKTTRRTGSARSIRRWSVAAAVVLLLGGTASLWTLAPQEGEEAVAKAEAVAPKEPSQPMPTAVSVETPPTKAIPKPVSPSKPKRKRRKQQPEAAPTPTSGIAEAAPATPRSEKRTGAAQSLANHLQRTMQSRERLIAEARSYMSGNCLNRSMPPQDVINETQE